MFVASGTGLLPQPQEPVSVYTEAGSNTTMIIPFRNPMDHAVLVDVSLKGKRERKRERERVRQTDGQTDTHTHIETDIHTGRQTERRRDKQTTDSLKKRKTSRRELEFIYKCVFEIY